MSSGAKARIFFALNVGAEAPTPQTTICEMVSRSVATSLAVALVALVACDVGARQKAAAENQKAVELTQVDLFSLPDWKHRAVAVDGFVLGMSRTETTQLAQARGLELVTKKRPKKVGDLGGPCREEENSCAVYKTAGPWIGVDLFFDAGRLAKIKIAVPDDAADYVKEVNVAHQFKGLTYQFFNHYSESLRNRILGPVEGKEESRGPSSSVFAYVEYEYPHLRTIVHVTVDRRDHPPQPFDLEVDFTSLQQDDPRKEALHTGGTKQ